VISQKPIALSTSHKGTPNRSTESEGETVICNAHPAKSNIAPIMQIKNFPCYMCEQCFEDIQEMMEHLIDDHNIAPKSKKPSSTKIDDPKDRNDVDTQSRGANLDKNLLATNETNTIAKDEYESNNIEQLSEDEDSIDATSSNFESRESSDTESFDQNEFWRLYDKACDILKHNDILLGKCQRSENDSIKTTVADHTISEVNEQNCELCDEKFETSFFTI